MQFDDDDPWRFIAHWIRDLNLKTGRYLLTGALCCDWMTEQHAMRPPGFSAFLKLCGIFLRSPCFSSTLNTIFVRCVSVSINGPALCSSLCTFIF